MNTTKKSVPKTRQGSRIPKGLPGAGRFASRDQIEILKAVQRELNIRAAKDRKNAKLREKRAGVRAKRAAKMAKPVEAATNAQIQRKLKGWGSRSTSRLRAGTRYHWHALVLVSGGSEAIGKIAKLVGSERFKLRQLPANESTPNADTQYEVVFTPWLGAWTPAEADERGEAAALAEIAKYQAAGATVEYLGMFYNKERFDQ